MNKNYLLTAVLSLILSACSSTIPEQLRIADEQALVSYADVKLDPTAKQAATARWGGVIAKVENQKEYTVLEVVNLELAYSAKPIAANESQGRFKVFYKGLLDPVIYQKGKSVTAVGVIAEPESGKIGELEYQFPVLMATGIYLWKDTPQVNVRVRQDPLMSPFYDPFYYHRGYAYPPRVIIKQTSSTTNKKSK